MYGIKQSGKIGRSVLIQTLMKWKFKLSTSDPLVFFLRDGSNFLILAVAVDCMAYASNSAKRLEMFKHNLPSELDIKFFGELK